VILVTLGTVYNRRGTLQPIVDAVAAVGPRVVVAAGSAAGTVARHHSNVRVTNWTRLDTVLDSASVVVHHGGTNTTLLAALHGTPSVVIPHGADQATNALLAERAGFSITVRERGGSQVTDAVRRCIEDDSLRTAARAVGDEIHSMPTGCDVLRTFLGST
jgi:UDP:flavonoid glycosyltransferase YjiC (YdhE family)